MAQRAYKNFAIQAGGTPQPLIGTWLTAAVTAAEAAALTLQGGGIQNAITLTVADSSMFDGAQYLSITDPSTYATESKLRVIAAPTATTVVVTGLKNAHPGGVYGTGSWVYVGDLASVVRVQAAANTGVLYIGDSPRMVKATGIHVLYTLNVTTSPAQPSSIEFTEHGASDTEVASQFWIDGTTSDTYLPSLGLV